MSSGKNANEQNVNANEQTNNTRFQCLKCNKVLSSNQRLKHHQNKCNGLYSRQCEVCFRMFTTTQGKYQHNKYVKCKPPIQVQSSPHTINNINNTNNIDNSTTHRTTTTTFS